MQQQDLLGDLLPKEQQQENFTPAATPRPAPYAPTPRTQLNLIPQVDKDLVAEPPTTDNFTAVKNFTPTVKVEIPDVDPIDVTPEEGFFTKANNFLKDAPGISIPQVPWQSIPDTFDDLARSTVVAGAYVTGKVGEFLNTSQKKDAFSENVGDDFVKEIANANRDVYYLGTLSNEAILDDNLINNVNTTPAFNNIKDKTLDNIYNVSENLVGYFGEEIYTNFDTIYQNPDNADEINKITRDYAGHTFTKEQLKSGLFAYQSTNKVKEKYAEADELMKRFAKPTEIKREDELYLKEVYTQINKQGVDLAFDNNYRNEFETPASRFGILQSTQDVALRTQKKVGVVLGNLDYMGKSDQVVADVVRSYYTETVVPQMVEGMGVYQSNIHKGEDEALRVTNKYFTDKYGYNFTEVDSYKALVRLGQQTNNAVVKDAINNLWFEDSKKTYTHGTKPLSFNESINMLQQEVALNKSLQEGSVLGTIWNYTTKKSAEAQQLTATVIWNISNATKGLYDATLGDGMKPPSEFLSQNNLSYIKNYARVDQSENYFFDNIKNVYTDNFDSIGSIIVIDGLVTKGTNLITQGRAARRIKELEKVFEPSAAGRNADIMQAANRGEGLVGQKINPVTGMPYVTPAASSSDTGLAMLGGAVDEGLRGGRLLTYKEYTKLQDLRKELYKIPVAEYVLHVATQTAIVDSAAHNLVGGEYDPTVGMAFVGALMMRQFYKTRTDIMAAQGQMEKLASFRGALLDANGELTQQVYKETYDAFALHFNTAASQNLDGFFVGTRKGTDGALGATATGPTPSPTSYDDLSQVQKDLWKNTVNVSVKAHQDLLSKPSFNGSVIAKNSISTVAKAFGEEPSQVERDLSIMQQEGLLNPFGERDEQIYTIKIQAPKILPSIADSLVKMSINMPDVRTDILTNEQTGEIGLDAVVIVKKNQDGSVNRVAVIDRDRYNENTGGMGVKQDPGIEVTNFQDFAATDMKALPNMQLDEVDGDLDTVNNSKYNNIIADADKKVKELFKLNPLMNRSLMDDIWAGFHPYAALKKVQFTQEVSDEIISKGIKTKEEADKLIEDKKLSTIQALPAGGLTHDQFIKIRDAVKSIPEYKNIEYEAIIGKGITNFYYPVGIRVAQFKADTIPDGKSIAYYQPAHTIAISYSQGNLFNANNSELKDAVAEFIANDYVKERGTIWKGILPKQLGFNMNTYKENLRLPEGRKGDKIFIDNLKQEILKRFSSERATQNILDKLGVGPFPGSDNTVSFGSIILDTFGDKETLKINQFTLNKDIFKRIVDENDTVQNVIINDEFFDKITKKFLGDYEKYPASSTSHISGETTPRPIGYTIVSTSVPLTSRKSKVEGQLQKQIAETGNGVVLKPIYFGDHSDLVMNEQVRGMQSIYFINDRNDYTQYIQKYSEDGSIIIPSKIFFSEKKQKTGLVHEVNLTIQNNKEGAIYPEGLQRIIKGSVIEGTESPDIIKVLQGIEPLNGNHIVIEAAVKHINGTINQSDKDMTLSFSSRSQGQAEIFDMIIKGYNKESMMNWLNKEMLNNPFTYQTVQYYYDFKGMIDKPDGYNQSLASFYNWSRKQGVGGTGLNFGTTHAMQVFEDIQEYIRVLGTTVKPNITEDSIKFIKKYLPFVRSSDGILELSQEANDNLVKIFGLDKPNGLISLSNSGILGQKATKIVQRTIEQQGKLGVQLFAELLNESNIPFFKGDMNLYDQLDKGNIEIHIVSNNTDISTANYHTYQLPLNVNVKYYSPEESNKLGNIIKKLGDNKFHIIMNNGYPSIEFKDGNTKYGGSNIAFVDSKIGGGSEFAYDTSLKTLVLKTNNKTVWNTYGKIGDLSQLLPVEDTTKRTTIIPGLTQLVIKDTNAWKVGAKYLIDTFHKLDPFDKKFILAKLYSYIGGTGDISEIAKGLVNNVDILSDTNSFDVAVEAAMFGDHAPLKKIFGEQHAYDLRTYVNAPAIALSNILKDIGITGGSSHVSSSMLENYIVTGRGGDQIKDLLKKLVGLHFDDFTRRHDKSRREMSITNRGSNQLSDFERQEEFVLDFDEVVETSMGAGDGSTDADEIVDYLMEEITTATPNDGQIVDTVIYSILQGANYEDIISRGFNKSLVNSMNDYDKMFEELKNLGSIPSQDVFKETILSEVGAFAEKVLENSKGNHIVYDASILNLNAYVNAVSDKLGYRLMDKTNLLVGKLSSGKKLSGFIDALGKELDNFAREHSGELNRLASMQDRNKYILGMAYNQGYVRLPVVQDGEPSFKIFTLEDLLIDMDNVYTNLQKIHHDLLNNKNSKLGSVGLFRPEQEVVSAIPNKNVAEIGKRPLENKQSLLESILQEINNMLRQISNSEHTITQAIKKGTIMPMNLIDYSSTKWNTIKMYRRAAGNLIDTVEGTVKDYELIDSLRTRINTLSDEEKYLNKLMENTSKYNKYMSLKNADPEIFLSKVKRLKTDDQIKKDFALDVVQFHIQPNLYQYMGADDLIATSDISRFIDQEYRKYLNNLQNGTDKYATVIDELITDRFNNIIFENSAHVGEYRIPGLRGTYLEPYDVDDISRTGNDLYIDSPNRYKSNNKFLSLLGGYKNNKDKNMLVTYGEEDINLFFLNLKSEFGINLYDPDIVGPNVDDALKISRQEVFNNKFDYIKEGKKFAIDEKKVQETISKNLLEFQGVREEFDNIFNNLVPDC